MSFNGGRGGFRGGPPRGRGGGSIGGRGRGRGGGPGAGVDMGPPAEVLEMGKFMHAVEGDILCASTNSTKIPYFNAAIYLENKTSVGKVDEILGPINEVHFTVKPGQGVQATSFRDGDKFFIGPDRLLPIERFLPKPKGAKVEKGARGARGGRGAPGRGTRGASRGRGGFGGGRGFNGGRGGPPRGRGFAPRGGPPRGRGGLSRGRGR